MIVVSLLLTLTVGFYLGQAQQQSVDRHVNVVIDSCAVAGSNQANAIHDGGTASVNPQPSGQCQSNVVLPLKANMNISLTVGVYITCASGDTFNGTGPFTCPPVVVPPMTHSTAQIPFVL